jgi:hypothetical protein
MKKQIIILVSVFMSFAGFAQDYVPTQEDLNQFQNTKTLVVLEANPLLEYNIRIQEVVKKEWKITNYEFISTKEFEEKRKNPEYSFLVMTEVGFERDKTKARYNFLHLLLGGDYFRVNEMPDLAAIPIGYASVPEDQYMYKLNTLVRFLQHHIRTIIDDPDKISKNAFKYYKDNMQDIKDKTLYLLKDELAKEINSEIRIKEVYPHKFKIVTKEEIRQAIEDREENVVFLHKVGPEGTQLYARCYKIIIGADNPKLYYFNFHMIKDDKPDALLKDDLENLAKGKSFSIF